jgi:hypothetical protein
MSREITGEITGKMCGATGIYLSICSQLEDIGF